MARRRTEDTPDDGPEVSTMADGNDAEDPRTFEHPAAEAVRQGTLSAAQLPEGHGNVDPDNPDAQYPPGVVDNRSTAGDVTANPADFVPEKRDLEAERAGFMTTAATPDYGTNAEE